MATEHAQRPADDKYLVRGRGGRFPKIPDGMERRPHAITMTPPEHRAFAELLPLQRGDLVASGLARRSKPRRVRARSNGVMAERNPRVEVTFGDTRLAQRLQAFAGTNRLPGAVRALLEAATEPDSARAHALFLAARVRIMARIVEHERYLNDARNGG